MDMKVLYKFSALKHWWNFLCFEIKNEDAEGKWEREGEGNKKFVSVLHSHSEIRKDGNVYLFLYNDDWLKKQQHFFVFRLTSQKKKVPETHKIANAKWKEANLGVCGGVMVVDWLTFEGNEVEG